MDLKLHVFFLIYRRRLTKFGTKASFLNENKMEYLDIYWIFYVTLWEIEIAMSHPPQVFNNINVIQTTSQKHLGIILDTWLSFEKHLETLLCKKNNAIGLPRKLQNLLPRTTLITLYKAFACLHLDYGDIIYDQARNGSFHEKLESFQYNAWLAITRAIRGSSREKLY